TSTSCRSRMVPSRQVRAHLGAVRPLYHRRARRQRQQPDRRIVERLTSSTSSDRHVCNGSVTNQDYALTAQESQRRVGTGAVIGANRISTSLTKDRRRDRK